jgi:hypothetical protein
LPQFVTRVHDSRGGTLRTCSGFSEARLGERDVTEQAEKLRRAVRESRKLKPMRANPRRWGIAATVMVYEIAAAADAIAKARHWDHELVFRRDARWAMLRTIERTDGCPSMSDLARALRISRQAARRLAVKAAQARLVDLLPNPDDRRIIRQRLVRNAKQLALR